MSDTVIESVLSRGDRLVNHLHTAAKEAIEAAALADSNLAVLEIGNTLVNRNYVDMDKIKIIAGGGTGHEPLYSGYVGEGMLTAAIHGDVMTAPPSCDILNVIRELSYKQNYGIVAIIRNNPGDTINFALAAQRALNEGINLKLLVMTDDCSEVPPSNKTDQPRGLTGIVIMMKLIGGMTEDPDVGLKDIEDFFEETQKKLATVLLSIKPPDSVSERSCICRKSLELDEIEIGAGLQGESHGKRIKLSTTDTIVAELLRELSKNVEYDETSLFVLLVNNMCKTKMEENVFVGSVVRTLKEHQVNVFKVYYGTFMTSMELQGFTLTILKADERIIKYLERPTDARAWQVAPIICNDLPVSIAPRIRIYTNLKPKLAGPRILERQSNTLLLIVQFACDALISCERQLNIIDKESGDGDTGTRIRLVCKELLKCVEDKKIDFECPFVFFKYLARKTEAIGGTMGAIYGIIFEAAANVMYQLPEDAIVDAEVWLKCLCNAVSSIRNYTKNEDGANNMLAPLMACANRVEDAILDEGLNGLDAFELGVAACEEASQATKQPDKVHPDPGAHSVTIWMRATYEGVKFRWLY